MSRFSWKPVYELTRELTESLRKYAKYLEGKKQKLSNDEDVIEPTVLSDKYHSKVLNVTKYIKPILATRYKTPRDALKISEPYKPIFMNEYSSCNRRRRFEYVKEIVVPVGCQQYTYTGGQEHLHWIWRTIPDESQSDALQNDMRVTVELQSKLPVYISRSIKREFVHTYGRFAGLKPALLRSMFVKLTEDQSAAANLSKSEIDDRVREMVDAEDADLIWDLRLQNNGRPEEYTEYLSKVKEIIETSVETSVHERRHDDVADNGTSVSYMATALSAADLYHRVNK